MKLTFDSETHSYFVDDKKVPGVSDIMQAGGLIDFGKIPEGILAHAAERGTNVHLACEYYDTDSLDYDSVQHEIVPYFNAWVKFCKDFNPEFLMIEQRLYSETYDYAGTIDRVAIIGGVPYLLDIKSGAKRKEHAIQTAAYAELIPNNDEIERACVYLDKEGNYKFVGYDDPNDFVVFICALSIYNFKKGGKKNENSTGFISPESINSLVS